MKITLPQKINDKLKKLKGMIKKMRKVIIAYSGGADSSFLLKISRDILGKENVIAVTAKSQIYPLSEYKQACKFTKQFNIKHIIITTDELKNRDFIKNSLMRCYFCKKELFQKISKLAKKLKIKHLLDGTNLDDKKDFRPGSIAAKEFNVKSPLSAVGLSKKEINLLSNHLGLPTAFKPPMACLASRIPYGEEITVRKLKMIEKAEEFIEKLGFHQVRVRYHNNIARIEIQKEKFKTFLEKSHNIVKKLKSLGFIYVTLDLEGYRQGSMNEAINHHLISKSKNAYIVDVAKMKKDKKNPNIWR